MDRLPKRVTVHLNPRLASLLLAAKTKAPLKSLSELLGEASVRGFDSEEERLETITPSLTGDEDFEELEV